MKISLQVLLTANQLKRLKGGFVGYDAGKKIKGKKRHILVDTQGLLIKTFVTVIRKGLFGILDSWKNPKRKLKIIWVGWL